MAVADPGFSVGGADPLGGADLQRVHFLVKTNAKTKEMDPVGGRRRRPLDPPTHGNKFNFPSRTEITKGTNFSLQ